MEEKKKLVSCMDCDYIREVQKNNISLDTEIVHACEKSAEYKYNYLAENRLVDYSYCKDINDHGQCNCFREKIWVGRGFKKKRPPKLKFKLDE